MQLLKQGNLPKKIAIFTSFSIMTAGILAGCSKPDTAARPQRSGAIEKTDTQKLNQDMKNMDYLQRIRD